MHEFLSFVVLFLRNMLMPRALTIYHFFGFCDFVRFECVQAIPLVLCLRRTMIICNRDI